MIISVNCEYSFEFKPEDGYLPDEFYDEDGHLIKSLEEIQSWVYSKQGQEYLAKAFQDDVREWTFYLNDPFHWNIFTVGGPKESLKLGL